MWVGEDGDFLIYSFVYVDAPLIVIPHLLCSCRKYINFTTTLAKSKIVEPAFIKIQFLVFIFKKYIFLRDRTLVAFCNNRHLQRIKIV